MICKWLYKILSEDGVWHELICNKYLHSKSLSRVRARPTDSPFWKGLLKVKDEIFKRGSFLVGNGESTRFWKDIWLGIRPYRTNIPRYIEIKKVTVASVLAQAPPVNISYRRILTGNRWQRWVHLLA